MKEFALKHPVLTFFLFDALICTVGNVIMSFAPAKREKEITTEVTVEEGDEEA